MKEIHIMEWNIHQQGRQSDVIPMFILDYITNEDVVILLEVNANSVNINEFIDSLGGKGFNIYMTNYESCGYANDILIAVNSNIQVNNTNYFRAYDEWKDKNSDIIPENLFLDIQINNKNYVIAGIRIKELRGNYEKRKKQMETLIKWTDNIESPIILIGDFNNLRENTKVTEWNIHVLDRMITGKFVRETPKNAYSWGVSYCVAKNKYDGYIREDHLLRSVSLDICNKIITNYFWDYLLEDDINCKCEIKDVDIYGQQDVEIPVGIPDHAIFRVQIKLK